MLFGRCLFNDHHCIVANPTVIVTSSATPLLVLECTAIGGPAVITWGRSSSSRVYVNDENHRIDQSLLNRATSTFKSRLTFIRHPYLVDSGERVCTATSTYVSTNSSETNTSVAIGMWVKYYPPCSYTWFFY